MLESLWRDVRVSARSLRRSPGFALATIVTLAVGIGATTAVFAIGTYGHAAATLTGIGTPARVLGAGIAPGLFAGLGVPPLLGRTLEPADGENGADPLVRGVVRQGLSVAGAGHPHRSGRGAAIRMTLSQVPLP